MPEQRFGIGLIVPSSNTVMESDFHRGLPGRAAISTTRIFLESVTRDAESDMVRNELPRATRLIRTAAPDVIVFGCTSAGSLEGLNGDHDIAAFIEEATQIKAVTVLSAVIDELTALKARRIAILTPYTDELSHSVANCIDDAGFLAVQCRGMGLVSNRDIGRVTPDEITSFVLADKIEADCAFLSCTNWRAIEALPVLQQKLNVPIVTSNEACLIRVCDLIAARAAAT